MKRFLLFTLIIIGVSSVALAQSGRRVKYPIPGTTSTTGERKTEIQTTEPEQPKTEEVGYSETAPNQPVSISVRSRNRKDSKPKKQPKKVETAQTSPNPTSEEDEVIKVDTKLISIPVTVIQKNGLYAPSLSQPNFTIFEDGKEQEIAYFASIDKPFSVVLLLDVSGSLSERVQQVQTAAAAFVEQMFPQDRVMVVAFDDRARTLCDFTNDKSTILNAIGKSGGGGATAIYNSVEEILDKKFKNIEGKKSVILFTDGVDSASARSTYESSVAAAVESEAVIFPIYYNTFLDMQGIGGGNGPMTTPPTIGIPGGGGMSGIGLSREEYALGRRYIQDLANATGGRIYRADSSQSSLNQAFEGIAEELRSQYEIGYYSNSTGNMGEVKRIKIRVNRPNLIVRARDSYVVN